MRFLSVRPLLMTALLVALIPAGFWGSPSGSKYVRAGDTTRVCAVEAISYTRGTAGGGRNGDNLGVVLGEPGGPNDPGFVSLGRGGTLIVRLGAPGVSADGTPASDLFVYESGTQPEFVFVAISSDGVSYTEVGRTGSQASGIDLDALGFAPGVTWSYVRVTDDRDQGSNSGDTGGADIDAVCGSNLDNLSPTPTDDAATFIVGETYTIDVLANDSDPDQPRSALAIESVSQPAGNIGTVTFTGGSMTFVPVDPAFSGTVSFSYTVIDGRGGRAIAEVTLTIDAASSSPSASVSPSASASADASDTASPSTDPASLEPSASASADTSVEPSSAPSGVASDEPSVEPSGDASVEPSVEPEPSGTNSDAPAATLFDGTVEAPVDGTLGEDLATLVDNPDGAPLVFTPVDPPANGDVVIEPDGTFTYVPDPGFSGTDAFRFALTVAGGTPGVATVTVTVSASCSLGGPLVPSTAPSALPTDTPSSDPSAAPSGDPPAAPSSEPPVTSPGDRPSRPSPDVPEPGVSVEPIPDETVPSEPPAGSVEPAAAALSGLTSVGLVAGVDDLLPACAGLERTGDGRVVSGATSQPGPVPTVPVGGAGGQGGGSGPGGDAGEGAIGLPDTGTGTASGGSMGWSGVAAMIAMLLTFAAGAVVLVGRRPA